MEPRLLAQFLPPQPISGPDEILDLFLAWAAARELELYPAQEEALLELMAGRHVILNTPTGSGKTLVSQGLQFKALCEGKTCFYTSPIKALASEKFFDLCDEFGADRVGMQTGDASINPEAPIICCTAEVLSNRALRQGETLAADYVVMDEFHYYGDPDRGVAWQVPLITLPNCRFLLMSATLGNTAPIAEKVEAFTGVPVSLVYSEDRPVPLDYEYRETPLHETVVDLLEHGKAPIYVVSFTQRECAERAQALTSANITSREERQKIRAAIGDFHFDTPYGKEIRRFLGFGVAVHHAGLLPKYRLLVEQLAQQGLLQVICGTDTLGVGVNIPIRTVLFSQLSKFDGEKVSLLKVRDFKQISGRAGRKGFDDRGSVVCQAPENVIRARRRAAGGKKKSKKSAPKAPPGTVSWNRETFQRLMTRPPETLQSRFRVSHGMIVNLLQRDAELNLPGRDNFSSLREILDRCHEKPGRKRHLLRQAAMLVRSMHRSNVLTLERDTDSGYLWVVVNEDLQWDFSLFQALALYMVEAIEELDAESESYPLDVMSLVEAILENPRAVLYRQVHKLKGDLVGKLKAQGVPYEERMEKLDEVSWEKPNRDFLERTFADFRRIHPWVRGEDLRPKSIAREIYENYHSFKDYVRRYGMQRLEGTLLRYLSQFYKTLSQSVPERAKTEEVYDIQGYFRTMLDHTDTSLLEEWESLLHPELLLDREKRAEARRELRVYELFHDPRAFRARVRAELHQLVRCLAEADWEEAAVSVLQEGEDGAALPWTPERLEVALEPFLAEHEKIVFDHQSRLSHNTRIEQTAPRQWEISQVLVDPDGDNTWALEGVVDLRHETDFEGPLIRLRRIGH